MKCVKNKKNKTIRRVANEAAQTLVKTGEWEYCPKSEWKVAGRN